MKWLSDLLSDSPAVSSKRLITVVTLLLLVACTIGLLCGIVVAVEYYWILATLCAGSAGLTVLDKKI